MIDAPFCSRARAGRLGWVLAAWWLIGAAEPVLVPDVNPAALNIIPSFKGTDLLLFGAIVHPDGARKNQRIDIIVSLRGPGESIIVREKRKLGGLLWANAASARFRTAPAYYWMAASRPLNQILDARTASIYELGLRNLHLSPASSDDPAIRKRFERGLIDLRIRNGLYGINPEKVIISENVLYRARLPIPSSVSVGRYVAETLMVRDGRVIAAASREVDVRKIGIERVIARAAINWPWTYGLLTVALSLMVGWASAMLFGKNDAQKT